MRIRVFACLCAFLTGCGSPTSAPLVATGVEITAPTPGSAVSAGYMTLVNNTTAALSITRIESPQFGMVAMHETTITDGVSRMQPIDALTIGAKDTTKLKRGAKHLMLMQPRGEFNEITLNFYGGDTLLLTLQIAVGGT